MHIKIGQLIVIIVLAIVAWYANEKLNTVPIMKPLISVAIVIVAVFMALGALGLMSNNMTISF
jgi:hypothetical protein